MSNVKSTGKYGGYDAGPPAEAPQESSSTSYLLSRQAQDESTPMVVDNEPQGFNPYDDGAESDVQRLFRLWQNERGSPEILHSQDGLLGRILDQIRRQTQDVDVLRLDANLSEEDHYMTTLVQTEVERVKFIVRSYIRTRLMKIEQYAAQVSIDPEVQSRLSRAELQHAKRYASLIATQFQVAVLNHLPESQQSLNEEDPLTPKMVPEPNKQRPVFIRARQNCGPVQLPDGTGFDIESGSIHLMRYQTIEHLLAQGEVDLV